MFRRITFSFSVVLCIALSVSLFVSDAQAQFGGYGGGGFGGGGYGGGNGGGGIGNYLVGGSGNYYANQNNFNDPRLGYCLENDCLGGNQGNQGFGNGNRNCGNCQQAAPRSRFVVERGGRRVLTYVGTYEGFAQRYPQYAGKVARPVAQPVYNNSNGFTTPAREVAPGYDSFGNPLPREIPQQAPAASTQPRTGNGSRANVNGEAPAVPTLIDEDAGAETDESPSDLSDNLDS